MFAYVTKSIRILFCPLLLFGMGITACEGTSSAAAKPTPCAPEAGNANLYIATPQPWIDDIYLHYGITIPFANPDQNSTPAPILIIPVSGNPNQQLEARYAALQFLAKETRRWSDIQTVKLDDSSEAHIIITFVHPDLVQAVILNEVLMNAPLITHMEKTITEIMEDVSTREELLFMVTVVINHHNPSIITQHTLEIPINEMVLINAGDTIIHPLHDDHNLARPINTAQKQSEFGYVGYPIGIQSNGKCIWVLDTYNTNIVVVANAIYVDSVRTGTYTWTIRYRPLIDIGLHTDHPNYQIPQGFDPAQFTSSPVMPVNISDDANFWVAFSRFVWEQVLYGN
jgi:hypothetical protein